MKKISIIVPIFNVEKYLEKCLEDISNQTYHNIEIILVNDGSTDSSEQICRKFVDIDNRFQLITKENGGLSDARNVGISKATGDYLIFIDSDDRVSPDFLKLLLEKLLEEKADIVECGFSKFSNDVEVLNISVIDNSFEVFSNEEAMAAFLDNRLTQVVWNKIYKKEVIGENKFPIGKIHEDEFWTYKIFSNASKIVKINNVLYYYRQQPLSIMAENYSLKRLYSLEALEERANFIKDRFPKLYSKAVLLYSLASLMHYQNITKIPNIDQDKKARKRILENLKNLKGMESFKDWPVKNVFWHKFLLWAPDLCVNIRILFKREPK